MATSSKRCALVYVVASLARVLNADREINHYHAQPATDDNIAAVFSFDVETNGLWGQPFAVAALVYDENGNETARFVGRCPISNEVDDFVAKNVLPQMGGITETHDSYESLLRDFAEFYLREKQGATVIAHMAVPVESGLGFATIYVPQP